MKEIEIDYKKFDDFVYIVDIRNIPDSSDFEEYFMQHSSHRSVAKRLIGKYYNNYPHIYDTSWDSGDNQRDELLTTKETHLTIITKRARISLFVGSTYSESWFDNFIGLLNEAALFASNLVDMVKLENVEENRLYVDAVAKRTCITD